MGVLSAEWQRSAVQMHQAHGTETPVQMQNIFPDAYKHSQDPRSDAAGLMDSPLEAFYTLQVPVKTLNNDRHLLYRIRCTGLELFRHQDPRHDSIFVGSRPPSAQTTPGSLDGRVPAQLNAVFQLQDPYPKTLNCLAHISLFQVIGSQNPNGPEGIPRVRTLTTNHIIQISDIEGMGHLIPVEPDKIYLVNNRIDQHTWNDIHDGN